MTSNKKREARAAARKALYDSYDIALANPKRNTSYDLMVATVVNLELKGYRITRIPGHPGTE